MRLALGSRRGLILRQLLTEAVLVSLVGGVIGLVGGIVILHALSAWQPIPDIPVNVPVNPDVRTYVVALLLSVISGMLFGIGPDSAGHARGSMADDSYRYGQHHR